MNDNFTDFKNGIKNGIPIMLGYFTVSFTFGLLARNLGLNIFQASLISFANVTSAGQFSGINIVAAGGSLVELAISQLIINSRYMLMSSSLSQKIASDTPFIQRAIMAYGVTDEIYGLAVNSPSPLNPYFMYGAMAVAIPGWTLGTTFGVILGNILPNSILSAMNIALYAMLISAIIPSTKHNRVNGLIIFVTMATSFIFSILPILKNIGSGLRIVIISIFITSIFAKLFPIREGSDE